MVIYFDWLHYQAAVLLFYELATCHVEHNLGCTVSVYIAESIIIMLL